MICGSGDDNGRGANRVPAPEAAAPGLDRGPQLLRLLAALARFGIDPMAPALLVPRCTART